jgi:hypothetical protein
VNQEGLTLPRVLKVASLGAGKSIERYHRRNRHRINDGAAFTTRVTDTGCSSGMRADAERNLDVVNLHKAKSKIRVVAEHPAGARGIARRRSAPPTPPASLWCYLDRNSLDLGRRDGRGTTDQSLPAGASWKGVSFTEEPPLRATCQPMHVVGEAL